MIRWLREWIIPYAREMDWRRAECRRIMWEEIRMGWKWWNDEAQS